MYVLWDKRLEKKWCILNLYGSAHEDKKEFLWELAFFCAKCKDPYVVGRDFNILRFSFEKNKAFVPNRFSDMFNSVINAYDLRQIYMFGGFFTWSNNQANPTLERLDSILVSKEWEGMYPTCWSLRSQWSSLTITLLSWILGVLKPVKVGSFGLSCPG
jgi:hypothetical protein